VSNFPTLIVGREPGRQPLQAAPTLRVFPDAEPARPASAIAEAGLAGPLVDAAPQSSGAASGQLAGGGLPAPLQRTTVCAAFARRTATW